MVSYFLSMLEKQKKQVFEQGRFNAWPTSTTLVKPWTGLVPAPGVSWHPDLDACGIQTEQSAADGLEQEIAPSGQRQLVVTLLSHSWCAQTHSIMWPGPYPALVITRAAALPLPTPTFSGLNHHLIISFHLHERSVPTCQSRRARAVSTGRDLSDGLPNPYGGLWQLNKVREEVI